MKVVLKGVSKITVICAAPFYTEKVSVMQGISGRDKEIGD